MKITIALIISLLSVSLYSQIIKYHYLDNKIGDYNDTIERLRYENAEKLYKIEWQFFTQTKEKPLRRYTAIDTLCFDSICFTYFPNGQIKIINPYINGVLNGYIESYYSNGQLEFRERMINGKSEDGYSMSFNADGSIRSEGKMQNGFQVGKWYIYPDGGLFKKYTYNYQGKLIDEQYWNGDKKKWERNVKCNLIKKAILFFKKL